jgi:hypothetical protein
MTITDTDRQAALLEVLKGRFFINDYGVRLLALVFGVSRVTILEDVKLLRSQAKNTRFTLRNR